MSKLLFFTYLRQIKLEFYKKMQQQFWWVTANSSRTWRGPVCMCRNDTYYSCSTRPCSHSVARWNLLGIWNCSTNLLTFLLRFISYHAYSWLGTGKLLFFSTTFFTRLRWSPKGRLQKVRNGTLRRAFVLVPEWRNENINK